MKNRFERGLKKFFSAGELERMRSVTIGIAGCGGLGSNCALILTRCGFQNFIIADHDCIESSNLNRQAFYHHQAGQLKTDALCANLRDINPDIQVQVIHNKLDGFSLKKAFNSCDVVIEAVDETSSKVMIVKHFIHSGKLLVSGSGISGTGNTDRIVTRQIRKRFYMVGDFTTDTVAESPSLAPGVMIVAAKQADVVLAYTLKGDYL